MRLKSLWLLEKFLTLPRNRSGAKSQRKSRAGGAKKVIDVVARLPKTLAIRSVISPVSTASGELSLRSD